MKKTTSLRSITGLLLGIFAASAMAAASLLGHWQCQGADGAHSLRFQNESTLIYDGEGAQYALLPGTILVQDDDGIASYGYQLEGNTLAVQFPDGAMLQCQRGQGAGPTIRPAERPPNPGGDNAALKRDIAGTWWGYSGSTERKIGLCPDGSYVDFTESGYSGRTYDSGGYQTGAWGTASQSGNRGRWTIQGDTQSGVIHVVTRQGGQFRLNYRQTGERGCLYFNGNQLCRTSGHCE